jgi:hypothetical protein
MAASIAGYAWSGFVQDTARDVWYAGEIAAGRWFPLEGPILGGAIHLGPMWFYLLSLPALLGGGWLSIALFAGFLAAVKFPLALDCGTRLLDRRFGFLWALCLAIPGWTSFEPLVFFNANPAAAAVLAALALWLRSADPRHAGIRMAASGFVVAAALHVHPTTAPIALLAVDGWRRSGRATDRPAGLAACLACGFALPFVPYVVSQWAAGFPDANGAARYLGTQVALANLAALPRLLASYFVAGPAMIVRYLWPSSSAAPWVPAVLYGLPLAALVPVIFLPDARERAAGRDARRVLAFLVLALAVFAAWIAVLRPATPEYFVFAMAPAASGLAALGLHRLFARPAWRIAAGMLAGLEAAAALAVGIRMAAVVESGEGVLTSRILDIANPEARTPFAQTWFPAWGHGALGRFLCESGPRVVLHGPLAYVVDRSVGADALLTCGTSERSVLMGSEGTPGTHWAGMSRRFWALLGRSPDCRIGSLGLVSPAAAHGTSRGIPIANGRRYFPRDPAAGSDRTARLAFDAPADDALLVSNPLLGYERLRDVRVTVGGRPANPVARNDLALLFAGPSGSAPARWSVSFEASTPEAIDLVTFSPRPWGAEPPPCGRASR